MKRFTFNGKKYIFRKEVLISNLSKLAIGGMLLALYSYMFAGMMITIIEVISARESEPKTNNTRRKNI